MFNNFFQLGMQRDDIHPSIHPSLRDDCLFVIHKFWIKFYTNFVISKNWWLKFKKKIEKLVEFTLKKREKIQFFVYKKMTKIFKKKKHWSWGLAINNNYMCFFLSGKVRGEGKCEWGLWLSSSKDQGQLRRRSFIAYTKWEKLGHLRWGPFKTFVCWRTIFSNLTLGFWNYISC